MRLSARLCQYSQGAYSATAASSLARLSTGGDVIYKGKGREGGKEMFSHLLASISHKSCSAMTDHNSWYVLRKLYTCQFITGC